MAGTTGVYPCHKNQFKVGAASASSSAIGDMETFSVSFDNGIEEWTTMDTEGWTRRLMTAKSVTISVTGKRNIGDVGNDFIAGLAFVNGTDAQAYFCWTFPSGAKVEFDAAVIDVKNMGGGDATNVAPLEFDVMSNGKPTYTPAV